MSDAREPSNTVIERIERFCTDYAQCLMDSTILVKRNYESMDLRAVKKAEVVEDRLIRELAEYIATAGAGTCRNTQDDFDFMCSECGKCVDNGRVLGFNYCPNCGARIKED